MVTDRHGYWPRPFDVDLKPLHLKRVSQANAINDNYLRLDLDIAFGM